MEILNETGELMTKDELRESAIEELMDILDCLDEDEALDLGNEYRAENGENELHRNDDDELNKVLSDWDPYDILKAGRDDWSSYADFFSVDGWGELGTTDDIWERISESDLAEDLIDGRFIPDEMPDEIAEVLEEYKKAKEELEQYNPYRAMCQEVVRRFVNNEADVTDLLQVLDKLAKSDEAWSEE